MILAVSTNKGGVLKTSISVNLATIYAQDEKVLLIDTDNQADVAVSFGINPDQLNYSLYDVLVNNLPARHAVINVRKNLDLLPANDELTFFDFDVLSDPEGYSNPFYILRERLEPLLAQYDKIIIDTPPHVGLMTYNVLSLADEVLIPFHPETYSMRSLIKIVEVIKNVKNLHNRKLEIAGIIATLVDKRTTLHKDILKQCQEFCAEEQIKVFKTVIPRSIIFPSSIAYDQAPGTTNRQDKKHAVYNEIKEELENDKEKGSSKL